MKLVIGLTGPALAGKGTFADIIEALFQKDGHPARRHGSSDIIRQTLSIWGIPHGRENEQRIAQSMTSDVGFGKNAISRAMEHQLEEDRSDVGIFDGVRWPSDETMIRGFAKRGIPSVMVYVTATPEMRFARLKKRNRSGEASTTWEMFQRQEQAPTETLITDIGSRADIKVENNYEEIADFWRDIEHTYEEKLKPMLKE